MNKIYQLITSIQLGGAEIIAFNLAEHCAGEPGNNTEITIVELYRTKNNYAKVKKRELTSKNIRLITLHRGGKRMFPIFATIKLIYCIWKDKPSIVHSHTDLPDFVLSIAKRFFSFFGLAFPDVVRTIHSTQLWHTHNKLGKISESAFNNESIVAVSSFAMHAYEQLRKKYNLPVSANRRIIYNGSVVPGRHPHFFRIDKNKINIAFCGRFEDYKGMETLIPAISEVGRMFPNHFVFHIIGDGSYKCRLLQLSQLLDNVYMYDPIPNVSTMIYAFDYLFMPSHFEGLALTSIEASFSGVPVIAAHAPGLDETLPENWPLKFHLENNDELYSIFENIKEKRYNKKELQQLAYNFISERFSLNKMVQSYNALYNKML